ncbi:MAG TPA: hypothetical protein VKY36_06230 [Moheibacter sp.]|nr:hypothetical protein [Moheibacter sp.]
MIRVLMILVLFFIKTNFLFSQQTTAQKELLTRASKNSELLNTDPEQAFIEAKKIEKRAKEIYAQEAELQAISNQCEYFMLNHDFKNMTVSSKYLLQKAMSYKSPVYQVIAKIYISKTYLYNNLLEDAFQQLNDGAEIIRTIDKTDSLEIITTTNFFITYSNYSILNGEYDKAIDYMKKAIAETDKLPNSKLKEKRQYINYANLAASYINIDQDSAKHYALRSLSLEGYREDVKLLSLNILGVIAGHDKDYESALSYFKEAEKLKGYGSHINLQILYDNIIESHRNLNDEENVKLYERKRDSLKLTISESKNKSLRNLLGEKVKNTDSEKYLYATVFFFLVIVILLFFVVKKNRILARQEKIDQQYLKGVSKTQNGEDYSKLLELLKKNDPAFMVYFNETFPDFSSKLLTLNPKISVSEIEFCAYFKLKIPTKEIARYKFIAPKTVFNKKYIIRKKLDIPKGTDIYQWFNDF